MKKQTDMQNNFPYSPCIGDKKAHIAVYPDAAKPYFVLLQIFKFDSIRQESYWVTTKIKSFRLRADAEAFVARNLK